MISQESPKMDSADERGATSSLVDRRGSAGKCVSGQEVCRLGIRPDIPAVGWFGIRRAPVPAIPRVAGWVGKGPVLEVLQRLSWYFFPTISAFVGY